jgi:hypothetical protein
LNPQTRILKKSLTNKLHSTILEIVGRNPIPLSSREIEYQYARENSLRHLQIEKKSRSAYKHSDVYRVIKELAGVDTGKKLLLGSWNDLCNNKDKEAFKSSFVKNLNKLLVDPKHDNNESYIFNTYQHDNKYYLDIESPNSEHSKWPPLENNIIRINFDSERKSGRIVTDYYRVGIPIYIKHDDESHDFKLYVKVTDSTKGVNINRIVFFQQSYGDSAKKENSRRGKISTKEISQNDFKYSLTLKGFILFLLGDQSNRISNSRIDKVIEALKQNEYTRKDYPFLWNYKILDKIQGRDFKINLLKRIAFEAQHLLIREDENFLRYWITSQFHTAIARLFGGPPFFNPAIKLSLNYTIKLEDGAKWIKDYDKKMLEYSLRYLQGEEAHIGELLKLKARFKGN